MANTLKFGNGEWYGKKDTILAYNDENSNYKPLPFNFSRASKATVINKDGLIEEVGSGQPRIDYKDDSKGALLLEPSRTNSIIQSENLGTSWSTFNGGYISTNESTSPDGLLTADKLSTNGTSFSFVRPSTNPTISTGNTTFTVFAKADTSDELWLRLDYGTNIYNRKFNLTTQTISTGFDNTGNIPDEETIEDYGNGWYRLRITDSADTTIFNPRIYVSDATPTSGDSVFLWGAQLESGSYATSYIPTQGSVVTRLADSCSNGGNEQVFDNNTSVLFIDFSRFIYEFGINTSALTLRNSSGSEQIRFHFDYPSKVVRFRDAKNGFTTIGGNIVTETNTRKKVALKIDGTTLKVFADGSQIGSDYTRPNAFDFSYINLGSSGDKLFDIKYYNTTLTDQELAALTQV